MIFQPGTSFLCAKDDEINHFPFFPSANFTTSSTNLCSSCFLLVNCLGPPLMAAWKSLYRALSRLFADYATVVWKVFLLSGLKSSMRQKHSVWDIKTHEVVCALFEGKRCATKTPFSRSQKVDGWERSNKHRLGWGEDWTGASCLLFTLESPRGCETWTMGKVSRWTLLTQISVRLYGEYPSIKYPS